MSAGSRTITALLIASLGFVASSCDLRPTDPLAPKKGPAGTPIANGPPGVAYNLASLECVANRIAMTVVCANAQSTTVGVLPDIIVGNQGVYMTMASSNVAYNSGTGQFTFDATLQNLIPQIIGTTDGTTLDPNGVRVFFNDGPTTTSGSGVCSVIPDGFATFTAAGQAYYTYMQLIAPNVTSAPRTWTLVMPPTVTSFAFHVYVSAPVQYPLGFIKIQPIAPLVHPDVDVPLSFQVLTAVGNVVPGAVVTWSSTDITVATVDPSGVITPLRAGTVSIDGTDGTRPGSVVLNVSGAGRSWGGATNTDWQVGTNWPLHNIVAGSLDTVTVPTGVPNMPTLTQAAAISGIVVGNAATLDVASFDLTVTGRVTTSAFGTITSGSGTGRVVQLAGTVDGILPTYRVNGTVQTSGNVTVSGTLIVVDGTLKNIDNTILVKP